MADTLTGKSKLKPRLARTCKAEKYLKNYEKEQEKIDIDDKMKLDGCLKRKQSRKEMRKEFRARKKARIHAHFTSRNSKVISTDVNKSRSRQEMIGKANVKKVKKKKKNSKMKQQDPEAENEDQEISELEKKLKLKKNTKLPKAFFEEGLSDLIDVCNIIQRGSLEHQVQTEEEAGLISEDSGNELVTDDESDGYMDEAEDKTSDEFGHVGDEIDSDLENEVEMESEDEALEETDRRTNNKDESEQGEEDEDKESINEKVLPKLQKSCSSTDIYGGATAKYVPPQLREKYLKDDKQVDERLRKQVKGLLNRLSESNLSMVSGQIEELYMSNSRNDLNEILSKLLMDACISPSLMPEGLLREHMMLVAILNSLVGSEVGAFFLQKLAVQFQKLHSTDHNCSNEGKEIHNVVALFAFLYSFKVVDCTLIYDIIRQLVASFREQDVELLLLLIRLIGVEIRRESPASLKDIILEVQAKAAADTELTDTSRKRFMLETINALRNNNIRKIPNYDPSQTDRARKILKSVIHDTGQNDSSKLSISLSDLLSIDQKGRWWIVGSAWSQSEKKDTSPLDVSDRTENARIIEIARQQRMNTDIRRNIFCIVMTSEDYIDAFEKLMRLKLKDKQSREIIHVLMDCSLQVKMLGHKGYLFSHDSDDMIYDISTGA